MTTAVRERPILFSAPMVRALLDGRKTQTRRIVKPQPAYVTGHDNQEVWAPDEKRLLTCPYGVPGDRLWVRETLWHDCAQSCMSRSNVRYAADCEKSPAEGQIFPAEQWVKVPSIHMPRWASRLTLTITDVRVQRLQDISEEDAIAEGLIEDADPDGRRCWSHDADNWEWTAREAYAVLWGSINGPGSWAANPWVWAITFTRAHASPSAGLAPNSVST